MTAGAPASSDRGFLRERGLQAERTALAWNRTALALAANALLTIRSGVVNDAPMVLLLGAALLLAAVTLVPLARWRKMQLLGPQTPCAPDPRLMRAVFMVAMLAGAVAVVATLPHLLQRTS